MTTRAPAVLKTLRCHQKLRKPRWIITTGISKKKFVYVVMHQRKYSSAKKALTLFSFFQKRICPTCTGPKLLHQLDVFVAFLMFVFVFIIIIVFLFLFVRICLMFPQSSVHRSIASPSIGCSCRASSPHNRCSLRNPHLLKGEEPPFFHSFSSQSSQQTNRLYFYTMFFLAQDDDI